ncbi:BrnA antitoxin family protein [Edwardsiella anguillarum]|nr:BrnA antitoxin family protein [Edwardsiella anguillarum]
MRYSPEVIAAFRSTGRGWQTRMDAALKDWLTQHNPADVKI